MKIKKVEVIPLSLPTDDVPPRRRYYCVIKISTDDGLVGWGECTDSFGHSSPLTIRALMQEKVQWALLDQDPLQLEELIHRVRRDTYRYGGFRDLLMQAISGVEIALWDIRGKVLGKPVSELLGKYRDKLEVYASGKPAFTVGADYQVEFNKPFLDRGVKTVKVRIGNNFDWDAQFMRDCRDVFGDDMRLFVDGKYNYTAASAIRMSYVLADVGAYYFEEPLPDYNLDEIARVAEASPIPIAYGEHCYTVHDFREFIEHQAASILQPDPTLCGGLSEAMKIVHFVEAMGYPVIPHAAGNTVIGLAACVHFGAAIPKFDVFEYDSTPVQPLRDLLPTEPLLAVERVVDGCIPVPTGPGLGVEINEAVFAEYPHHLDESIARSFPVYGTPHI
jgi:L-alanine-DL-glutamate epimerase-like enolase superfamily enzyme